jgi:hypothetical protein
MENCSTGQSPQRAVVPVEKKKEKKKLEISGQFYDQGTGTLLSIRQEVGVRSCLTRSAIIVF